MLSDGFSTEIQFNFAGITHLFRGRDGKKTAWKNNRVGMIGDWVCVNEDGPLDIAAKWRRTLLALTKQGQIQIMPNYVDQSDLTLATGLVVDEWARDMRRKRAVMIRGRVHALLGLTGFLYRLHT